MKRRPNHLARQGRTVLFLLWAKLRTCSGHIDQGALRRGREEKRGQNHLLNRSDPVNPPGHPDPVASPNGAFQPQPRATPWGRRPQST